MLVFSQQLPLSFPEFFSNLNVHCFHLPLVVEVGGVVMQNCVAVLPHVPAHPHQFVDECHSPAEARLFGSDAGIVPLLQEFPSFGGAAQQEVVPSNVALF